MLMPALLLTNILAVAAVMSAVLMIGAGVIAAVSRISWRRTPARRIGAIEIMHGGYIGTKADVI